jgi:hypothetical protein
MNENRQIHPSRLHEAASSGWRCTLVASELQPPPAVGVFGSSFDWPHPPDRGSRSPKAFDLLDGRPDKSMNATSSHVDMPEPVPLSSKASSGPGDVWVMDCP